MTKSIYLTNLHLFSITIISVSFIFFPGFGASFETVHTRNKTVIVGDNIELECYLHPSQDHNLLWEHRPVHERLLKTVIAGNFPNAEYASRFSVSSTTSKYNLIIENVHVQDAGMYLCNDQDEIERRSDTKIELIVLDTPLICASDTNDQDVITENTCGVTPTTIKLTCSASFHGNMAPDLHWNNVEHQSLNNTSDNRTAKSVMFSTVPWKPSGTVFTCQTSTQTRPCFTVVTNPHYLESDRRDVNIYSPQRIDCSVSKSPSVACVYEWVSDDGTKSTGYQLDLAVESSPGTYTCVANCDFQGKSCLVYPLVVTYLPVHNARTTDVVPIILTTILTCIICSVVFCICLKFDVYAKLRKINTRIRSNGKTTEEQDKLLKNSNSTSSAVLLKELPNVGQLSIKGVTVLEKVIYIVRFGAASIERYDQQSGISIVSIPLPGLKDARDMASCKRHRCLYVSDGYKYKIHRVSTHQLRIESWTTSPGPEGLSVTSQANVLLVCSKVPASICEFTTKGDPVRRIMLPNDLVKPLHAISITDGSYLVCHGAKSKPNRICRIKPTSDLQSAEVDAYYDGAGIFQIESSMWPTRMASAPNGCILVSVHKKILLLPPAMDIARICIDIENHFPSRLYSDDKTRQLVVTENDEKGRILIFDISGVAFNDRLDNIITAKY